MYSTSDFSVDNNTEIRYCKSMTSTAKRNRKPNFSELMDSLMLLCKAEAAGETFCQWLNSAVGGHEDAQTYLSQVIARTSNPVIAMLAKQAIAAR